MGADILFKSVTGVGYGDEGKGLMTDYFCSYDNHKPLNVKVNGGAQAGHTVCTHNGKDYKHWVFRQYGSGTFAGADTFLFGTFMVNIVELLNERQALTEIYDIQTNVFIDRECRVTLPVDIVLNRFVENKRTHRHGSCGLGIYETFHRNKDFKQYKIRDLVNDFCKLGERDFEEKMLSMYNDYMEIRVKEMLADGIVVDTDEIKKLKYDTTRMHDKFIDSLAELGKVSNIKFVSSIDELIDKYGYNLVVCECSQGLELDQFNYRNWPHVTPSSTGLANVAELVKNSKKLKNVDLEACFVTRSYKTKHGAGIFVEYDEQLQGQYGLYDRTNQPNEFQGTLRYGCLNIGRIKKLILEQVDLYKKTSNKICSSIAITHLDQTNNALIIKDDRIEAEDIDEKTFGVNYNTYMSYGEKRSDIIIM